MKKIISCLLISLTISCQEADISPDEIASFDYSYVWGMTGALTRIHVTKREARLQHGYDESNYCTSTTSQQEWQNLLAVTRIGEFKNFKTVTNIDCYDCGGDGITIQARGKKYSVSSGGWKMLISDSSSVGSMAKQLWVIMKDREKKCP